jgi:uncharacterized membrane protein YwzB
MFTLQEIDPKIFRKKTRNATLIMMAVFIVIGFITASLFVEYLGPYSNNHLVLNFMGAFVGLVITAFIIKTFFADKEWMKEGIYGWRLKRNLMYVTNVLRHVKEAVEAGDQHAMKVLRFYHLGLEQMHRFEDNNHALIDLAVEKRELEATMEELGLELNQTEFDPEWVEQYSNRD